MTLYNSEITPRGGVQYKSIRKILPRLIILAIFGAFLATLSIAAVYADDEKPEDPVDETLNYIVRISPEETFFPDGVDQSTISWDAANSTLTLNNYNGPQIKTEYGDERMTIEIIGENTIIINNGFYCDYIDGYDSAGICSSNSIKFVGNGALNFMVNGDYDRTYGIATSSRKSISVDGPQIILNNGIQIESGGLILNSGSIIDNDSKIYIDLFVQNGGELFVTDHYQEEALTDKGYFIFNGGTAKMEGSCMPIWTEYEGTIAEMFTEKFLGKGSNGDYTYEQMVSIIENEYGLSVSELEQTEAVVLFNGGDITLSGLCAAIQITHYGESSLIDRPEQSIKVADNMIIDPATAQLSVYEFDDASAVGFSDGTGDIVFSEIDEEPWLLFDHALKTVHIYEGTIPTPNTDGSASTDAEEVPNTLDYHLLSIIATVLVSIVAEAFIILDLKKRTKVLQDQITTKTANNTTNDYLDSISPKSKKSK